VELLCDHWNAKLANILVSVGPRPRWWRTFGFGEIAEQKRISLFWDGDAKLASNLESMSTQRRFTIADSRDQEVVRNDFPRIDEERV
jgi:hypothetical protein